MSSPRHLWSGDWELDSSAARRELEEQRRRQAAAEPQATSVAAPAPPPPPKAPRTPKVPSATAPSAAKAPALAARASSTRGALRRALRHAVDEERRAAASTRWGFDLRASLLIALAILLAAAAGYGVAALVTSGGSGPPSASAASNRARTLLGIEVAGSPDGIVITTVVPNGPAQLAGLMPGDLLNQINGQPIGTVDGVSAALAGLQPGDTVAIQFSRGLVPYTTQVKLTRVPTGGP